MTPDVVGDEHQLVGPVATEITLEGFEVKMVLNYVYVQAICLYKVAIFKNAGVHFSSALPYRI